MTKGTKRSRRAPEAPEAPEAPAPVQPDAESDAPDTPDAEPMPPPAEPEEEGLRERFLRLQADFDNFRKRTQRERVDLYRRANEDLISELLPVLDHFELGMNTAREHHADKAVVDGFQLVLEQVQKALAGFGLERVDAEGEEFNPHLHEAITHMPSDVHPADVVIAQTRCGYRVGDKLLRAAQVVVSSGPPEAGGEDGGEPDAG